MNEEPRDLVVELNLYFLQVISQIARSDVASAMIRFGITKEIAEALAKLNTAEIFQISRAPSFLFKVDNQRILSALEDNHSGKGYGNMHAEVINIAAMLKSGGGHA